MIFLDDAISCFALLTYNHAHEEIKCDYNIFNCPKKKNSVRDNEHPCFLVQHQIRYKLDGELYFVLDSKYGVGEAQTWEH